MNDTEILSYEMRLKHEKHPEGLIQELVDGQDWDARLLPALLDAFTKPNRQYVPGRLLAQLVALTESAEFYTLVAKDMRDYECTTIFHEGYYLEAIEDRLIDALYKSTKNPKDQWRLVYREALAKTGRMKSLELFKVLLYEMEPELNKARYALAQKVDAGEVDMDDTIQLLCGDSGALELSNDLLFLEEVRKALPRLEERIRNLQP